MQYTLRCIKLYNLHVIAHEIKGTLSFSIFEYCLRNIKHDLAVFSLSCSTCAGYCYCSALYHHLYNGKAIE